MDALLAASPTAAAAAVAASDAATVAAGLKAQKGVAFKKHTPRQMLLCCAATEADTKPPREFPAR